LLLVVKSGQVVTTVVKVVKCSLVKLLLVVKWSLVVRVVQCSLVVKWSLVIKVVQCL